MSEGTFSDTDACIHTRHVILYSDTDTYAPKRNKPPSLLSLIRTDPMSNFYSFILSDFVGEHAKSERINLGWGVGGGGGWGGGMEVT